MIGVRWAEYDCGIITPPDAVLLATSVSETQTFMEMAGDLGEHQLEAVQTSGAVLGNLHLAKGIWLTI
jgi:hypothetical protein